MAGLEVLDHRLEGGAREGVCLHAQRVVEAHARVCQLVQQVQTASVPHLIIVQARCVLQGCPLRVLEAKQPWVPLRRLYVLLVLVQGLLLVVIKDVVVLLLVPAATSNRMQTLLHAVMVLAVL